MRRGAGVVLAAATLGAVGAVGAAVATWRTYPRIGSLTYELAGAVDVRRAGLRSRTVVVDDLPMAVLDGGPADAPCVVLLHGFSAERGVWARFARHLTRDHRVLVPDLAGHGRTPFVSGAGYGAPAQAERVVGVLDALGVKRAHVAGNSMGGFVAATLALAHPGRVRSLALVDAAGVLGPERSDAEQILDAGKPNPFLMDDPRLFPAFYAMTMARPPLVPAFVRHAMAADYVARREALTEIFGDWHLHDYLQDRLAQLRTPTLVMFGAKDRLVHPSTARVWAEGISGARLVGYDDLGHMPMLEAPRRSATDYRAFLADL